MNISFTYPRKVRQDFLEDVVKPMIKQRRILKLTQEVVNHKLGVADNLVAKWECGVRTPILFHLYCWADALDGKLMFVPNNKVKVCEAIIKIPSNDNEPKSTNENIIPFSQRLKKAA
jgi:transcriptional regulator with XRE-family HTH domain